MANELTTKQTALRLGVAPVTVRQWCGEGRLKGARLVESPRGDYWLIPETALTNFSPPKMGRPSTKKATKRTRRKPADEAPK